MQNYLIGRLRPLSAPLRAWFTYSAELAPFGGVGGARCGAGRGGAEAAVVRGGWRYKGGDVRAKAFFFFFFSQVFRTKREFALWNVRGRCINWFICITTESS